MAAFDRQWRPTRSRPLSVLIVGGRATGTTVLVQLAGCVPAGSAITVVDPAATDYPAVFDDPAVAKGAIVVVAVLLQQRRLTPPPEGTETHAAQENHSSRRRTHTRSLTKGFPPLDACPWQDSIVGILDALSTRNRPVDKDKMFVWRYVTSVTAIASRSPTPQTQDTSRSPPNSGRLRRPVSQFEGAPRSSRGIRPASPTRRLTSRVSCAPAQPASVTSSRRTVLGVAARIVITPTGLPVAALSLPR